MSEQVEGYVKIPYVTNVEELIAKIQKEINPAFDEFAKEHKLPIRDPKIDLQEINNGQQVYVYLRPKKIPKQKMGTFGNAVETAAIQFFSGRRVESIIHQGQLLINPYIWTTLSLRYKLKNNEGENGCAYFVGSQKTESDSIYYSIVERKFYTRKDWENMVNQKSWDAEQERKKQAKEAAEKKEESGGF